MIPLEYIAFFNETGYGQAAYDMVSALLETGKYDIRLVPLNGSISKQFLDKKRVQELDALIRKRPNPRATQIYHCIPPMQMRVPRTDRSIGFGTFETYDPPSNWIEMLNRLDGVICPSQFNYKVFAHAGVKRPLFHIPHCYDLKEWNDKVIPLEKRQKFTFLFVGAWKRRKGWPELVEAFFREFSASENVQLIIKTDKKDQAAIDIANLTASLALTKELPTVLLEKKIFDNTYLPSFYKSSDCLVMPTLGEGFGLPGLQCMALKVPIIITNFSGCQEYASNERCTMIEPSGFMLHSNMDNIVQFADKKWPRITVKSVQEAMRRVFSNREEVVCKADKAYEYVRSNFSYEVVANMFGSVMETVYRVS